MRNNKIKKEQTQQGGAALTFPVFGLLQFHKHKIQQAY